MRKVMNSCTRPFLFILLFLTACSSSSAPEAIVGQWEPKEWIGQVTPTFFSSTYLEFKPDQVLFSLLSDAVPYKASYRVNGKVVTVTTDYPKLMEFMCTMNDYKGDSVYATITCTNPFFGEVIYKRINARHG